MMSWVLYRSLWRFICERSRHVVHPAYDITNKVKVWPFGHQLWGIRGL